MIRVGLRFDRRDHAALATLATRVHQGDLAGRHAQVFEKAAEAARLGEPLIVYCRTALEAQVMADGYVRFGVQRPAVEELTGHRPAR